MYQRFVILVIWIFLPFLLVLSQENSAISSEIDSQVWQTFIRTFGAYDGEGFNAIHTPDVLRGNPESLSEGESYFRQNIDQSLKGQQSGRTRSIAFTFEHRVHSDLVAYEVGYYRVTVAKAGEVPQKFFGQFHVVLRKENGRWRIAQDWDASTINGVPVSEEMFLRYASQSLLE